jgi:hypothetical protein
MLRESVASRHRIAGRRAGRTLVIEACTRTAIVTTPRFLVCLKRSLHDLDVMLCERGPLGGGHGIEEHSWLCIHCRKPYDVWRPRDRRNPACSTNLGVAQRGSPQLESGGVSAGYALAAQTP